MATDSVHTPEPPRRVGMLVCGTDGSARARAAVDFTVRLADQLGATVVLVHAVGLLEQMPDAGAPPSTRRRDEIELLLTGEWSESFRTAGVSYTTVMEDGPPLLVLPRVAERVRADLIVVASHGVGNAAGMLLGSTAHGLVQASNLPVVVVPAPPR